MDTFTMIPYADAVAHLNALRRIAVRTPRNQDAVAYSYLRFSDPAQAKGDSERRQGELLAHWLKKNPGILLDRSLKMQDRGASGFTGENRLDPRRCMTQFLERVENRDVLPGSYLVVENLDRLTREHPVVSIPWILNLIGRGIKIVQLIPSELVYDSEMDQGRLLMLLYDLSRGHGESKMKSERISQCWQEKWRAAREGKPFGKQVPAWLELAEGEYRIKPAAGRAVRTIFAWCAEGMGVRSILRRLEEEGIPSFGVSGQWTKSTLGKILTGREVLGEFQPMKGVRPRVPSGDPIPNYFPAVVTEAEWAAAAKARGARKLYSGRPTKTGGASSPFAGLLYSAVDGSKLYPIQHGGPRHLITKAQDDGRGKGQVCRFPSNHLVDALLSQLAKEVGATLFNDPGAAQVQEIEGRRAECERKLKIALERFDADPESLVWADKVSAYDQELRRLSADLRKARQAAATPISATWSEALTLMRSNQPERLRQCLLTCIEGVWCVLCDRGRYRVAAVQVRFADGLATRGYVIWSYMPRGVQTARNRERWLAISWADAGLDDFDLRNQKQAGRMLKVLQQCDPLDGIQEIADAE